MALRRVTAVGIGEWPGSSLGFIAAMLAAMLVATGLVCYVAVAARSYDAAVAPAPAAGRAPRRGSPARKEPEAPPDQGLVTGLS